MQMLAIFQGEKFAALLKSQRKKNLRKIQKFHLPNKQAVKNQANAISMNFVHLQAKDKLHVQYLMQT